MKTNIRLITSACFLGVCYLFPTCMLGVYTYKTYMAVAQMAFFKPSLVPAESSKISLVFNRFNGKMRGKTKISGIPYLRPKIWFLAKEFP